MYRTLYVATFMLQLTTVYSQNSEPNPDIIPTPSSIKKYPGEFIFNQQTLIKADTADDKTVAFFTNYLKDTRNLKNKLLTGTKISKKPAIIFTSQGAENFPKEGYKLTITPNEITIIGKDAGLFYGLQTLLQLFPVKCESTIKLPCIEIEDYPRFQYRGMMLDVSRHFFTVPQVKRFIDLMVAYKLNRFHWHLVDDKGWRIEIKKYPKLIEIASTRMSTMVGSNRDWFDQVPYEGHYTQEEIKDVIKYASDRYITIIPEIEMPAHSNSVLEAYPELKCELPAESKNKRIYETLYCPTEQTFKFLEDVLTEVIDLFPSQYIHIGGDEANKIPWKESAFCQNLMVQLNLKDENELQSYFIQRMEKFVNSKGRSIIGWDEILEGGLAPNATVMSWRGEQGGIAAAKQKHNVIMTPAPNGMYFDYYQSSSKMEPVNIGGLAPLSCTYGYDPVPKSLTQEERQYILGVQGNVWTEFIATPAKLEYMILPRMLALSEVAWTSPENKNYQDFSEVRMPHQLAKLETLGYNYRVPQISEPVDTLLFGDKFTFELKTFIPGAKIYYTINGRVPCNTDFEYSQPITFYVPSNEKRELQTVVISPSGKQSVPTRTVMYNHVHIPAVEYSPSDSGLKYKLVKGKFESVHNLEFVQVADSGVVKTFNLNEFKTKFPAFGVIYEGYINIAEDGTYKFTLSSTDGAQIFIDNDLVVDNDAPMTYPRDGALPLLKGYHKVKIKYYCSGRGSTIRLFMTGPDGVRKDLAGKDIFMY